MQDARENEKDWTPVVTERLTFRRPWLEDLAAAVEIHLDPLTNQHHPEPETVTIESSTGRFLDMVEHWDQHGFGVWVVTKRDFPDRVIGFTGLSNRVVHQRHVLNLYYRYRPDAWGNGYASEAALAAVTRGRKLLPDLPIVAYTTPSNVGSQRTALAVGLMRRPDLDIDRGPYTDIYFTAGW